MGPGAQIIVRSAGHLRSQTLKCGNNIRRKTSLHWSSPWIGSSCPNCQRHDSRSQVTPEPPLPVDRVVLTAPFSTVGVDHAGPLYARDAGKTKFYILLFTCAVIRAVYLELVGSLSTQDTVLAFRRFVARRGHPNIIYLDNSKTFIALSRHLSEKLFFFRPTWKFKTPRSPWVGGWWERQIQSVKKGLRKTLGLRLKTVVELTTVLNIVLTAALLHISVTTQNTTSLLLKGFWLLKPPFLLNRPQRLTHTMLCRKHRVLSLCISGRYGEMNIWPTYLAT